MQGMHIQQIRLETEGEYQSQEQLGKVGLEPTQGEVIVKLSQEEAERQLIQGIKFCSKFKVLKITSNQMGA